MNASKTWYEVWWWTSGANDSFGPYTQKRGALAQLRFALRGAPERTSGALVQVKQETQRRVHRVLVRARVEAHARRVPVEVVSPRDPDGKWR